jgi:DNA-binding PadR family transcriptional regulator
MKSDELKGHLDGLVLAVLSDAPAHGYDIIEQLAARSGGVFDLPEGTVYPALHRLEAAGFLSSTRQRVSGRERRVYRMTPKGRRSLGDRRAAWSVFSTTVTAILGSPA